MPGRLYACSRPHDLGLDNHRMNVRRDHILAFEAGDGDLESGHHFILAHVLLQEIVDLRAGVRAGRR